MSQSQRRSSSQLSTTKKTLQIDMNTRRSSKASTKTHNDNPQTPSHTKPSKPSMQLMFQANKDYLMDKIAISQIPKPSKYYHKIPSKTPNTTYNNQFHKINPNHMNQLRLERKDNLYNCKFNVTEYESLYSQNFSRMEQRSKSQVSTGKKETPKGKEKLGYQPNQAPTFLDTSYSLNFAGNFNPIPAQSAKMKEVKLMGGGKFKGESTYHGVFKNHDQKREHPIHHTNNKIFMTIDTPIETTYGKQFNTIKTTTKPQPSKPKTSQKQDSARKRVNSQMLATSKEMEKKKFKSEYERSFQTIQPVSARSRKVAVMSLQEMKNLILNVI